MALVVGDTKMADCPGLRFFMRLPHRYTHQNKLPALLRARADMESSRVEKPYELAVLVAVVCAAKRLRTQASGGGQQGC